MRHRQRLPTNFTGAFASFSLPKVSQFKPESSKPTCMSA